MAPPDRDASDAAAEAAGGATDESAGTAPDEVGALREELARTRAELAAERIRVIRRRGRFEAQLEAARRYGADRDRALRQARAELARPLVDLAFRITWHWRRWRGEVRRREPGDPPVPSGRTRPGGSEPTSSPPGPPVVGPGRRDGRRVAIHIGPETWDAAGRWGDTAFARALAAALGRLGWTASVHVRADARSPEAVAADAAIHIVGVETTEPIDGQPTILWLISHPDRITAERASRYDRVLVASVPFAAELAARIERPVAILHQAADTERFRPDPTGPSHELLFIGNSRNVRRPILDALAGTSRDVAVYGGGWRPDLLDPRWLRGEWVPNDELPRYYASAGIVLCDHWEDMRDEGFTANRVFDALACGAFVLSDHVVGIEALFDGAVATYDDPAEVPALVEHWLGRPVERRERAETGRRAVLERHTFDHRARTIVGELEAVLGRAPDPSSTTGVPAPG